MLCLNEGNVPIQPVVKFVQRPKNFQNFTLFIQKLQFALQHNIDFIHILKKDSIPEFFFQGSELENIKVLQGLFFAHYLEELNFFVVLKTTRIFRHFKRVKERAYIYFSFCSRVHLFVILSVLDNYNDEESADLVNKNSNYFVTQIFNDKPFFSFKA